MPLVWCPWEQKQFLTENTVILIMLVLRLELVDEIFWNGGLIKIICHKGYTQFYRSLCGFTYDRNENTILTNSCSTVTFVQVFYSQKSCLHLYVEVKDDNGEGNANSVELVIHINDVNDNAPVFNADQYQSFLLENTPQFKVPLIVTALDADEEGTENSAVRLAYFKKLEAFKTPYTINQYY